MTSDPLKRRHHTAPRVYLRGFADAGGMVVMRRREGNEVEQHIDNVSVRNSFYNVRDSSGRVRDDVENWFMRDIETPAGPVLARIRDAGSGDRVTGADARTLSSFVAVQLLRTATARSYLRQIDQHIGPILMASGLAKRLGVDPTRLSPTRRADLLRMAGNLLKRHQHPDGVRASHLRTTLRETDKMMVRLQSWHWEVLAAKHPRLITGDSPAVTVQPAPGSFSGLLPQGSPVYLPLSPTQLLVGTERLRRGRGEMTTRLARIVNQRVADEADDAIIKAASQPWPRGFRLRPEAPCLPRPEVRVRRSDDDRPTFSATYPPVASDGIRSLLEALEAQDVVE